MCPWQSHSGFPIVNGTTACLLTTIIIIMMRVCRTEPRFPDHHFSVIQWPSEIITDNPIVGVCVKVESKLRRLLGLRECKPSFSQKVKKKEEVCPRQKKSPLYFSLSPVIPSRGWLRSRAPHQLVVRMHTACNQDRPFNVSSHWSYSPSLPSLTHGM